MKYISNAQWPKTVKYLFSHDNITTDEHETREQAQAVCDMLTRDGMGGLGRVFPIKTWVEEKP